MNEPSTAEHEALEAATLWAPLIEGLNEAVWLVEPRTHRVVAVNEAALRLLGRGREAVIGAGAAQLLATPEDLAYWRDAAAGHRAPLCSDTLLCRADGATLHVTRRITRLPGPAAPLMVALHDHTERRRAEEAREDALAELRATLESTADGILVTDLAGRITAFNRRFADLWGLPAQLVARRDDAAVHDWLRRSVVNPQDYEQRLATIQDAALLQTSDRLTLHSGRVLERVTQPQWRGGRPTGRVYAFRDLTAMIAADHRIETLSFTDVLTGLPNRRHLGDRIAHAIATARRNGGGFALALLDLDHFKQINDTIGPGMGDRVLCEVAARAKSCLREVDLIARVGGDQFALLLQGASGQGAEATARRLLDAVGAPFVIDGSAFTLTCSIGIALYPGDARTGDELLGRAETAMQRAKASGRAGFRFHRPAQGQDQRSRMRLDHAMRQALASSRFRLHYQPQVELASGRVVGAEALIRWRDPELGDVSPGDFIPVAEESGFIVVIGDWVLAQAVRQAAAWRARGCTLPVSVNVSAVQFQQPDFVDRVAQVLAEARLPAALLELELTESILVHEADEALQRLSALSSLGVRLAIDDFGTGYSSLAYLKRFPIGKLKIDRSFVKGLPADDSDAAIVRAIVQMARALGLHVIAEGVESEAQRTFLHEAGCNEYQGFLIAPALDALSFESRMLARVH